MCPDAASESVAVCLAALSWLTDTGTSNFSFPSISTPRSVVSGEVGKESLAEELRP